MSEGMEEFKDAVTAWLTTYSEKYEVEAWDDPGDYPSNAGSAPLPSSEYLVWLVEGFEHSAAFSIPEDGYFEDYDDPFVGSYIEVSILDRRAEATWVIKSVRIDSTGEATVTALVDSVKEEGD